MHRNTKLEATKQVSDATNVEPRTVKTCGRQGTATFFRPWW